MEEKQPTNIYTFKDEKPEKFDTQYTASIKDQHVPLVIDNGSYHCRAGWASHNKPDLVFKNVTAKFRSRREKDAEIQIGNDISNFEMVRMIMRSQFDRNIITQYDVQEQIFDYMFSNLGINTDGKVDHPVVMTETVSNPNYCRQQMSELLFECYGIPKVTYGIDSLFSLFKNHPQPGKANSVVIDCGYQTTHILPVLHGRLDLEHCRRINIGGAHVDGLMQRLLQLKYPGHVNSITLSRAEELVRDHTYMAVDFLPELEQWASHDYYDENVHKIQLPYANATSNLISAQQQQERRQQQIRRLKELNVKKRQERLAEEEQEMKRLMQLQELIADYDDDDEEYNNALSENNIESEEELQVLINKLSVSIQRLKAVIDGKEPPPEEPEPRKQAVFDLLDIPDDQLSPDQLVKKKRQYILQKAKEGRAKAQAQQREKRQKELIAEKELEKKRLTDFQSWLSEVRQKRQKLLETRNNRKQKKQDMAKRKTYAAQQRMRIISQLAKNTKKEDTFGQDDRDWDVYKEINPNMSDSDSEAEELQLEELETMLKEHDPEFLKEMDKEAGEFDIAEYYRLHIGVERIRVPELLFQPSMIGAEQAGIVETLDYMFKKYTQDVQQTLAQYVFLTGGCANFGQFKQRMDREMLQMRPFKSTFNVFTADDPSLDAWLGARQWITSSGIGNVWITRAEYQEKGGDYLKEHIASNRYLPHPVLVNK
ncbi:actin-related protein 5-like [Ruditapes philippinarum]|uniref:actin-related protein 5-like n=1 Tax=Ruditapes philippinarum TaxID=129788 RepID=UPI00295B900D|nr:actin-related protein 5-like [Ruditapes philippinarum]XP_060598271.1 actin-related protein 5-like [Ruditapes philippinarum]XP_060598272.1 actin-related protein 5-like [Ruditapes philippinarum]XP_060598274.1 actin-related protein 5-like [Ruditapes philippinarum]XP_060598275.1 actin-related protein 5-like [Ruditapes philippinarum]